MADPMTIAALVSGGGSIAGSLLGGGGPDVPDVVSPAVNAAERRRRQAMDTIRRREDRLEGNLAASGMSGSGAASQREELYEGNNNVISRLDARLLDTITQARQRQQQLEYQAGERKAQARAEAIGSLANTAGVIAGRQFGEPSGGSASSGNGNQKSAEDTMWDYLGQTAGLGDVAGGFSLNSLNL